MAQKPTIGSDQINPLEDGATQQDQINSAFAATNELDSPYAELGDTGLLRFQGFISEEWFKQAAGQNGIRLIREMSDNHPVIGAILFAVRMLMRGVNWFVQSASEDPADVEIAEFIEGCMFDMEMSWQDTLDQMLSFLEFGWSMSEVVYKIRNGDDEDPAQRSQFTDKKIGIRKIAPRAQDTLFRFEMDKNGTVLGMWQQPPMGGGLRFIPRDRLIHLRPSSSKDNPLGRSVLRSAMVPYLIQKKLQEIESIGMERDLVGYPVIRAPGKIMKKDASPDDKNMLRMLQNTLRNLRRDSSEGIIMPSDAGPDGKPMFDISLIASGGSRQVNPDVPITRYDQRIAMVVLADFVMMGNSGSGGGRGSYGMAEAKQDMFSTAISAWLDAICEEFSRQVIPQLLKLNNMKPKALPFLSHTEVQAPNLQQLGAYISALSSAGASLFPDQNLEKFLRDAAGMPEPNPDTTPGGRGDPNANIHSVGAPPTDGNDPKPKPAGGANGQQPNASSSMSAQQPGAIS